MFNVEPMPLTWRAPPYLPATCKIGNPAVIDVALPHVRTRGCAIQAGAHVGVWPAALSPHFTRVIAFEPIPYLWRCAVDAVQAANVLVMPCALSSATGTVRINPAGPDRFSGSSSVGPIGIDVPAIRIDDLPAALLGKIGAIFLDIEGHELQALQGADETLRAWRPVVVVEQNAKSLRSREECAVADLLAPLGYRQVAAFGADQVFAIKEQAA